MLISNNIQSISNHDKVTNPKTLFIFTTVWAALILMWATSYTVSATSTTLALTSTSNSSASALEAATSAQDAATFALNIATSALEASILTNQVRMLTHKKSMLTHQVQMLMFEESKLTPRMWMLAGKVSNSILANNKHAKVVKKWFVRKTITPAHICIARIKQGYSLNEWRIIRKPIFMYFIRDRP